jgi:hypothetical protein
MKTSLFQLLVGLMLVAGGARAQLAGAAAEVLGVQNFDIALLCGINRLSPQAIDGSNVTLYGATAVGCFSHVIGYQFARTRGVSLWIELAPEYFAGGSASGSIPGSVNRNMKAHTLGIRLMVPLHSRISAYGAVGGGGGTFYYPAILAGSNPYLLSSRTIHGVFEFGGGVDLRLSRRFSIRGEVRDFVTGNGLSGVSGPNHVLPSIGVGFHF